VCDFTGEKRAQLYSIDFYPPLSYAVGPSREALEKFDAAARAYLEEKGWVHFDTLLSLVPSFFDVKRNWTVRRSSTDEISGGWKLASNWRINWLMNSFRKLNGEPWYRIALEKTIDGQTFLRWTFVHELKELNLDVFPEDIWEMLCSALKRDESEPNDIFLQKYAAAAWSLEAPSDSALSQYKL
jgi:hypothetical protein